MDKRGDIGSIVREASMVVMLTILKKWVDAANEPENTRTKLKISEESMHKIIGLVL